MYGDQMYPTPDSTSLDNFKSDCAQVLEPATAHRPVRTDVRSLKTVRRYVQLSQLLNLIISYLHMHILRAGSRII